MAYVDGFVLAVTKARLDEYKETARKAGEVWRECGALTYVECVAGDVPYGEVTSFPRAVQAKDDEVVVFSWVTYASRGRPRPDRRQGDRRRADEGRHVHGPSDMKRMIYGGFQPFMELSATS